jgi:hypothetical protein
MQEGVHILPGAWPAFLLKASQQLANDGKEAEP